MSRGTPYEQGFRDYYRYLDGEVGALIEGLDDTTALLVVSDHGAQAMHGGIQVNEWLMQEGYLSLIDPPTTPTPFGKLQVDWPNTRVWADGGYYSRIFMNVKGREPEGVIDPADYEALRDELIAQARGARRRGRKLDRHARLPADRPLPRGERGARPT